jgi:hypothetical protein
VHLLSIQPPRCHLFQELQMTPAIILLESQHITLTIFEIQRHGNIIKAT